jgi:predicted nucleotidyltransferase
MVGSTEAIQTDIDARRGEIARLCAQFAVRRLELFGSASAGAFDPARSDLDFLVEFDSAPGITPFEQYFGLKESLEALFRRAADLVMAGAPQNPYFLSNMNKGRRLLYAV